MFVGSSEIIAIDISFLSNDNSNKNIAEHFEGDHIYKHRDHKLRGFGSASFVKSKITGDCENGQYSDYRLVCGLGIKNLHVWRFRVPKVNNTIGVEGSDTVIERPQGEWQCMYDIVTNGITVECAEFLRGGLSVMSKSTGANVRVRFLLLLKFPRFSS